MALDQDGRPIPVSIPDPPNHDPSPPAVSVEQFNITAHKIDSALARLDDLSQRVIALEQGVNDQTLAVLAEHERRFDAMMLAKLADFEKRFEMLAAMPPPSEPPPPNPDPIPLTAGS